MICWPAEPKYFLNENKQLKKTSKSYLAAVTALLAVTIVSASMADTVSGRIEHDVVYHLDVAVSGEVKSVSVREGNRVTQGTVLMQLDTTSLEAKRDAALAKMNHLEAVMEEAARSLQRDEELYAEGSLSTVELDLRRIAVLKANADFKISEAEYVHSRGQVSFGTIVAPVAGIVVKRNVNPGERIVVDNRSEPAFIFASDNKVIRAELNPETGTVPTPGSSVKIDYPGGTISGQVMAINSLTSPDGVSMTVSTEQPLPQVGQAVEINYE